MEGFRGQHCEENIDDCIGNLCQNGATCIDRVDEYSCLCPSAFEGPQCERDVDECLIRPSLCHNGATCTNSHGSYSCICVNGWTGPDCSINIDDCNTAACFNGATCIDRVGSFYCHCTPGKTGLLCHLDDACTSNPCHEGAICDTSPINGSFTCSCANGYKGLDCSEDIDECEQALVSLISSTKVETCAGSKVIECQAQDTRSVIISALLESELGNPNIFL
ncbi:hypothetical protein PV325_005655 [Microctonus aethiopoides]|nr:hypothetical protein PV325_005655 [Microctonus aethiopoides]